MLDGILLWISLVFDKYYALLLPAALAVGAVVLRRRKVLLLALLLVVLVVPVLKGAFGEDRPCFSEPFQGDCLSDYGLPSFHAASSTVFVMAALGSVWFWPFAAFAAIASGSRVYLNLHSLSQVAGGVALGIALYAFSAWLVTVLERSEADGEVQARSGRRGGTAPVGRQRVRAGRRPSASHRVRLKKRFGRGPR